MHKNIIVGVLLICISTITAQNIEFPKPTIDLSKVDISKIDLSKLNMEKFNFGFKLSPAIGWLDVNHYDMQAGGASLKFGIGGIAEYSINNLISVVSGINYNTYGGYVFDSLSLKDLSTSDNFKLSYSQIEVPLGIKIKTPTLGRISYFLQGGLTSGFVLSAFEKHKKTEKNQVSSPVDIYSLTIPTNAGLLVSVGSQYKITKKINMIGEIAYKRILTNTADASAYIKSGRYSNQSDLQIYPGSMEFSLGFLFK
jgi:hypothetical protein